MGKGDTRLPPKEGESSHEPKGSSSSCESSLEMDCSELYSDRTEAAGDGPSNTQEMQSASSSLEFCMDYSEPVDEEKEEENSSNEDNSNPESKDNDTTRTCTRQSSLTLTVSSVETETDTTSGSEGPIENIKHLSQVADISLALEMTGDGSSISVSVSRSNSLNSAPIRKRRNSDKKDEEKEMKKRRS